MNQFRGGRNVLTSSSKEPSAGKKPLNKPLAGAIQGHVGPRTKMASWLNNHRDNGWESLVPDLGAGCLGCRVVGLSFAWGANFP